MALKLRMLVLQNFHRQQHGIIRHRRITDATASDGARPRKDLIDPNNTAPAVWADTAYHSRANEAFLAARRKASHLHRKKPKGKMERWCWLERRASPYPIGDGLPCMTV